MNQPPPLVNYNLFTTDRALYAAVAREGAGWACAELEEFGRIVGTAELIEWAGSPTSIRRCCTRTIAMATGATR